MATNASIWLEQLQRQVDEIEALRAVFPDGDDNFSGGAGGCTSDAAALVLDPAERQALELAQHICEASAASLSNTAGCSSSSSSDMFQGLPLLSGTIRPPGVLYGGQQVALRFTLPRSYPAGSEPTGGSSVRGGGGGGRGIGGSGDGVWTPNAHAAVSGAPARQGPKQADPASSPPGLEYQQRRAAMAVECSAPRLVHERLSSAVAAVAEQEAEAGCECLLLAVDALRDAVEELQNQAPAASLQGGLAEGAAAAATAAAPVPGIGGAGTAPGASATEVEGLLCSLVWLHHLKSMEKRKLIVQWARELDLAGACKPGFPGVVVVEGHSAHVREFLSRMRSLSWQAMQIRGQDLLPFIGSSSSSNNNNNSGCGSSNSQTGQVRAPQGSGSSSAAAAAQPGSPATAANRSPGTVRQTQTAALVEALRRLRAPLPFCELDEEGGMSQLGALCRAGGVHHVFLTALKL